jgi:hypothetical protein
VRELREWEKHRTEVSEVTEGEWELMAESFLVKAVASVRELREWGKHRTEVTEVTEGGIGVDGRKIFW